VSKNGCIGGLTVLGYELFVVRCGSSRVEVYNVGSLIFSRYITIPGSKSLMTIAACPHFNCLYIGEPEQKTIRRYDQAKSAFRNWSVIGAYLELSVTRTHSVMIVLCYCNRIQEFATDGVLIRDIGLVSSLKYPRHCVQLSADNLLVCHGGPGLDERRVCIVDTRGCVIQSYGGLQGSGVGQLSGPCQMAVDKHNHVFVADYDNNRIELLSPTLHHIGYVTIPRHKLYRPSAIHLDELNQRLYIGEGVGGEHLWVLQGDISKDSWYS